MGSIYFSRARYDEPLVSDSRSERRLAWLAWVTICLVWGTTYLAIRVALETIPVFLLAGLRWMTAGLILTAVTKGRGRPLPPVGQWGALALLGFLMNVLGNGFVVWAEQYVASGLTAVIIASVPFWSVGFEALLPGGDRLRGSTLLALAVGFAGIVVLVWPEMSAGGQAGAAMAGGVVAIQIACAGWALGTSYAKRHPSATDPVATSAIQMLASGTMLLSVATMTGEWSALHFTTRSFSALVYLTLAGSVVAYTAYLYTVAHLPLTTVSLYAYINPLIAVLLGAALLGEPLSPRIAVASLLVLGGMALLRRVQS
jgi:drug/metabolite transporter (DMT)-like permease